MGGDHAKVALRLYRACQARWPGAGMLGQNGCMQGLKSFGAVSVCPYRYRTKRVG